MNLDGKPSHECPVMLKFLKTSLLVLHFSYFTLMTFLMISSVILLCMLMRLLFTLSFIRHLFVATTTVGFRTWTGTGSLIWILEKLNLFYLPCVITLLLLMWKWMALWGKGRVSIRETVQEIEHTLQQFYSFPYFFFILCPNQTPSIFKLGFLAYITTSLFCVVFVLKFLPEIKLNILNTTSYYVRKAYSLTD